MAHHIYSQQVSHRGESEDHTSEKASTLKPRADPKHGYQWPHEKDSCPPIFFGKKCYGLNTREPIC